MNNNSNNDSLFSSLVDLAEESVIDIVQFAGDELKDAAKSFSSGSPPEMSDAQYFAHAVDDPQKYPPKDEAMDELVSDRQSSERIDAKIREANGGEAELSEKAKEAQMQDRMETYLAAQQEMRM